MKTNFFYLFTSLSFSLLIAAPGRLAFGIIICLEFFFLLFVSEIMKTVTLKLKLEKINTAVSIISIIFGVIVYKNILSLICPLIALQLSFVFFLPAVSTFVIGTINPTVNIISQQETSIQFKNNLLCVCWFTFFALIIYFLRDLLAYGTITLPSADGLFVVDVIPRNHTGILTFFASIPGTLILVSVFILIFVYIQNKFEILKRAEGEVC